MLDRNSSVDPKSIAITIDREETKSSTAIVLTQSAVATQENNSKKALHTTFALINGILYFYVASAGVDNIKKLFGITDQDAAKELLGVGIGASLCYGTFSYKLIENLTLRPDSVLSKVMTALAPFAASTFLTAGIQGNETVSENWFETPAEVGIGIGIALFALRTLYMIDGSVKFPNKIKELKTAFTEAIHNHDKKEIGRLIVAVYTSLGYSLASTDAICAATGKIASWLGADANSDVLSVSSYIAAGVGAVGYIPATFYWTLRGIRQATFGGKLDKNGVTADPTDRHTITGAIGTLPVVLGVLGTVTAADGRMFGKLGITSTVVRGSSSLIFAIAGGLPGLSTLSRNMTKSITQFFNRSNGSSSNNADEVNGSHGYVSLNNDDEDQENNNISSWCCWRKKR